MSTISANLIQYARQYRAHGFSILRTDGKKVPVGSWKAYQSTPIADKDIDAYIDQPQVAGLGVICGAVSGHLEVIDVDTKHALDPDGLFGELTQAIMEIDPELFPRLVVARTPSGGYHVYYRCVEPVCGNKKLANRLAEGEELRRMQENADREADAAGRKHHKVDPVICFIETRGEGGYVAAMPTPGYEFIQNKVSEVPVVTASERETLWAAVLSLSLYTPPIEEYKPRSSDTHKDGLTPLDDYNERGDVVGLLQNHGWKFIRQQGEKSIMLRPGTTDSKSSGDYHAGKRLFSVFTTSTAFEPVKGYSPAAVYAKLEHDGDFSKAAKALYAEGYGERRNGKKNGHEVKGGSSEISSDVEDKPILTFWHVEYSSRAKRYLTFIVKTKLERFLYEGGFGLYFYGENNKIFKLIHNDHGIISEVGTETIKKYVKKYIGGLPDTFDNITRDELLEAVYQAKPFSEDLYEWLEPINIDFLKDTKDAAYYPFRNGIVEVTAKGVYLKSYKSFGKSVWRSAITDRDIEAYPEESDVDVTKIEFYRFLSAVCGSDQPKIDYMMAVAGYLLHGFKDPARSYCIVLAEETEDESKGGGTGKGIFFKAFGKLIPQLVMDGKNFKLDKNFALQRVRLDHRLVVIDDVRARVDFEGFYSMITEGFTVEKKNKDELYIPYKDAPKIIFSTNYAIPAAADHARRRQRVVEFVKTFTPDFTPKDMFGHNLFEDWDDTEWNHFFNLLFACVQLYLRDGLKVRESSQAGKIKQVKVQFGDEFYNWFMEYLQNNPEHTRFFNELYANFISANDMEKKDYSAKRFKKALQDSARLFGMEMKSKPNRQAGNKVEVWTVKSCANSTDQVQPCEQSTPAQIPEEQLF